MPWEEEQVKASEAGYAGSVVSYFDNLLTDVEHKRLSDVRIPITNGLLQVKKPVLHSVTCKLAFTPSEEQLFSAYKEIPWRLSVLASGYYRDTDASLYVGRLLNNGEEIPIRFRQEVVPDERNKDNFKVIPLFPKSLIEGQVKHYNGFPVHEVDEFDKDKYNVGKKIVKELRREGHPISLRETECALQSCVSPRVTDSEGVLEVMKKGEEVDFYAKDYESSYHRVRGDKSYLHGVAWMEAKSNQMELGSWGSRENAWKIQDVMRDLIKAVDLRVEPDSMITLNKPVERLYSKIGSAVSHGLSLGLSGIKKAIVKPPSYAYKKLVQEPKENRLGIESQAVLETLKEAQIAQGSAESCLTQLKRECVLKRTEKIRQEKVEKK